MSTVNAKKRKTDIKFNDDNFRVCKHRLPNWFCGALGYEKVGDTPCECPVCTRKCDKAYLQKSDLNVNKQSVVSSSVNKRRKKRCVDGQ